ncbi:SWIM zinc finger family protein [Aeromonas allosaccharophila]
MARSTSHSAELIDIAELKAQSGDASFAKGVKLASQGAVQQLAQDGETITARVQGSHLYRVRLECGRTMVSHCNCPLPTIRRSANMESPPRWPSICS